MEGKMMLTTGNTTGLSSPWKGMRFVMAALGMLICAQPAPAAGQKMFPACEDAVNALIQAFRDQNRDELLTIFGKKSEALIYSGDEVADRQVVQKFLDYYDEQHKLIQEKGNYELLIGKDEWPFPIPIIERKGKFLFDTDRGMEEILNRRIGRNELDTIQVMHAIVDAQREYAMKDRDGDGLLEYAQKFWSDPGEKNGLYWETKADEEPSPLGPLVTSAGQAGYSRAETGGEPKPYHGYFFKILTRQDATRAGGTYDYLVNGNMLGGFAVLAYPAAYGNSGVMSFLVNHLGVVYQKDLGKRTEKAAKAIVSFNPDKTWDEVKP